MKRITYILIFLFVACEKAPEVSEGEINGLNYSNHSLGLSIDLPEKWSIIKDEESLKLIDKKSYSKSELKRRWMELNAKPILSAYRFQDTDFDKTSDIMINPNLTIYIEFIPNRSEVKEASDYLSYLKKSITSSKQIKYHITDEGSFNSSDFEFARLDYEFSLMERKIKKSSFLYKLGSYMINLTMSMEKGDKLTENVLMKSFYSMRFDARKLR